MIPGGHRTARGRLALLAVAAFAGTAGAQRLPVQVFGLREGLTHPHVTCLLADRKGYLWVGTWEGLSRCDGRHFVNYGPNEGLPTGIVNALCEDRAGRLWVATNGAGVARLLDAPEDRARHERDLDAAMPRAPAPAPGEPERTTARARRRFEAFAIDSAREANVVGNLWIDERDDSLLCVTEAGLYRGRPRADGGCDFVRLLADPERRGQGCVFRGRDGEPWVVQRDALLRVASDHEVTRIELPAAAGLGPARGAVPDGDGAVVIAHENGLHRVVLPAGPDSPPRITPLPVPRGEARILALARGRQGELLLGTSRGLIAVGTAAEGRDPPGGAPPATTISTRANGLPDDSITSILVTPDQSSWIGTDRGGLARIAPTAIVSYLPGSGPGAPNVHRMVVGADGRIYAATADDGLFVVAADRLEPLPGGSVAPFVNVDMRFCCDAQGDYWLGTDAGLHRCRGPACDLRRAEKLGAAQGLPDLRVFGEIRPDSGGRVWFGTRDGQLVCIDARDPERLRYEARALPAAASVRDPRALLPLADGSVWVAPFVGLWRWREDQFVELPPGVGGLPGPYVYPRALFEDRRGRLWVGMRFSGVAVSEAPAVEHPRFDVWSMQRGLASDTVWAVAEDAAGRIYLATGRGLDCVDVEARTVRHLGMTEGLAGAIAFHMVSDAQDRLWIGTSGGVSCLDPCVAMPLPPPPRVYVTRLVAGGREIPLPETGALATEANPGHAPAGGPLVLDAGRPDLWVEFTAVGTEPPRFEHRLLGADETWSAPSEQATLRFPRLAPGSYRLLVRARLGDGRTSEVPASVAFVVPAPIWARPWFLGAAALALALAGFFGHRVRLARALALERLRTEIATDLHDDLGSGLAQIAIQSEVGRRGAGPEQQRVLTEIALLARGMRESIADIVWAVDPRRDRLLELVRRARHVAFNLLDAEGLEVGFVAPADAEIAAVELPGNLRRHLLLFVKEAITNVARHARARKVGIELALTQDEFVVRIRDDGRGFDPAEAVAGHGLTSLQRRARVLGARFVLDSRPGAGTVVELHVPWRGRHRIDMQLPKTPEAR